MKRLLGLGLLLGLIGCKDGKEVIAACDMSGLSDGSVICIDVTRERRDFGRQMCAVGRGKWREFQTCDQAGALWGCKVNEQVIWTYPSKKHQNADGAACEEGDLVRPSSET